jgi:hypothetical protein
MDYCWLIDHRDALKAPTGLSRFDFELEEVFIKHLFEKLKKGYIEKSTDSASFLWAYGHVRPPEVYKPIVWMNSVGALSDLLF